MYYAGLDVSLKETFVSIINEKGHVVAEESISSEAHALCIYIAPKTAGLAPWM